MKRIIQTDKAPKPIGPYSQAVEAGTTLYVSGQIPIDPLTGETVTSSVADEAKMVMNNVLAVLNAAGYGIDHVVKTTIFLTDMAHFPAVNEIYSSYFQTDFPARETVAVAGLPKNVNVEISVIASK